jgi:hypothetical protein
MVESLLVESCAQILAQAFYRTCEMKSGQWITPKVSGQRATDRAGFTAPSPSAVGTVAPLL